MRSGLAEFSAVVTHRFNVLRSGRLQGLHIGVRTLGRGSVLACGRMASASPLPFLHGFRSVGSTCGSYQGQSRTCFGCGAEGYVAAGFSTPRIEKPSVFHLDHFPPLILALLLCLVAPLLSAGPAAPPVPISSDRLVGPVALEVSATCVASTVVAEVHPAPRASSVGGCTCGDGLFPRGSGRGNTPCRKRTPRESSRSRGPPWKQIEALQGVA